ncbi:MAG: carboxylating nicotinate-nucleotide diphosphorylase [Armatimonadetes bacterium]|nr:carboxylating nicotinate-nucleotide diphosphorylase [Armatimonadota bacterium]
MNWREIEEHVARALAEDVGIGDVTTQCIVSDDARGRAVVVAREAGVVAGLPLVELVYGRLDGRVQVARLVQEGSAVSVGCRVAVLVGPTRALLSGERVALNYLQYLSGIATRTAALVGAVHGTRARIVDTRKTVPGLRALAKYAVRQGGGTNHRFGLFDGVLIKDNHIAASGGVREAVCRARAVASHLLRIEVEADSLAQVREALDAGADVILLDNMGPDQLREAVELCRGRARTEASGGITAQNIRAVAETGVDLISVGALTHSVTALDLGLDWEPAEACPERNPAAG